MERTEAYEQVSDVLERTERIVLDDKAKGMFSAAFSYAVAQARINFPVLKPTVEQPAQGESDTPERITAEYTAQRIAQAAEVKRLIQLLSENRDTFQAAKQYLEYNSSTGRYTHHQITRQVDACQLAIDELSGTASSAWQPIETAPKDGCRVLLATQDGHVSEGQFEADEGWFEANCHSTDYVERRLDPAHWMALPAAPLPR